MRGSEGLLAHLEQRLNLKPGQTTPDGTFTLSTVECLASCGTAPMMMVNDAYHENLDSVKVDALLDHLAGELAG
jgi:NADH-quinone oxidoreductase subunit E